MNPRVTAVKILLEVVQRKRSLNSAILTKITKNVSETSLVKELCYGTLRWYIRLDALLNLLVKKPLKEKDLDIKILILIGLYQLLYLRTPEYAAVTETVEAAEELKKVWAKNFINGVLRTFLRQKDSLLQTLDKNLLAVYSHPQWLFEKIKKDWPEQWSSILEANNQHPPFYLRINTQKISRDAWMEKSTQAALPAEAVFPETAVKLSPIDVEAIPGFKAGELSVQDCAAQLAATLLDLKPGLRVLDACAAPGGKTAHIAELQPDLNEIIAIDSDATRLQFAKDNWQRLQLKTPVQWLSADASNPENWWDQQLFDRILLDAPCSATGVIRRHPDIKILRKPQDIRQLAQLQLTLIEKLWPLLKTGGRLVYSTCSILKQENAEVITTFLTNQLNAKAINIEANWGIAMTAGRQILPAPQGMDGFYYAILEKMD